MPTKKAKNKAKAKAKAKGETRAKAQDQRKETRKALIPLRERVHTLIREYEETVAFEHARRMERLLHDLLRAMDIGCEEAEKDLSRIEAGGSPCRPSLLRQRLSDLVGGF